MLKKALAFILLFSCIGCYAGESKVTVTTKAINRKCVNINKASKAEIVELRGIGDKKAEKIIESRNEELFKDVYDLKTRRLIGETTFENIKEDITIDTRTN